MSIGIFYQNQYAVRTEGAHEGGYAVAHLERFRLFHEERTCHDEPGSATDAAKIKIIISLVNHNWGCCSDD